MVLLVILCQLVTVTITFHHHVAAVVDSSSRFFVKTNVNSTCGEKEAFTAQTELNCAFKCMKKTNDKCVGFVHMPANAQCEVCFSCLSSFNQSKQLVSGAAQFAGIGRNFTAELAIGKS